MRYWTKTPDRADGVTRWMMFTTVADGFGACAAGPFPPPDAVTWGGRAPSREEVADAFFDRPIPNTPTPPGPGPARWRQLLAWSREPVTATLMAAGYDEEEARAWEAWRLAVRAEALPPAFPPEMTSAQRPAPAPLGDGLGRVMLILTPLISADAAHEEDAVEALLGTPELEAVTGPPLLMRASVWVTVSGLPTDRVTALLRDHNIPHAVLSLPPSAPPVELAGVLPEDLHAELSRLLSGGGALLSREGGEAAEPAEPS